MTESKPTRKGRRLGGPPPTPSTLEDPTPPEAPGQLVPSPGVQQTAAVPAPPPSPPDAAQHPDAEAQQGEVYALPARPARRPTAADIIQPRERVQREQISAMVPAQLELVRRMRLMWAHEGVEQRDQVALALDAWLTDHGF